MAEREDRTADRAPGGGWARSGYALAVFLSAACGLVLEIVAARLIAPYVGMSLYTWTAVIAVTLAGLSLGHWIGGRLAVPAAVTCHRRLAWLNGAAALAAVAVPPLLRLLADPILALGLDPVLSITLLSAGLFLLPALFIGTVSPILTELAIVAAPRDRARTIGRMYAMGAVGSIAGTVAAGFLFVSWIGSIGTVLAIAGTLATLAAAFALAGWRARRAAAVGVPASAAALIGALLGWGGFDAYAAPCTRESDYYCIRVLDHGESRGRTARLMVLDHMGHGINDRAEPTYLHSSYVELADILVRRRIAPAGQGAGLAAYFIGGGAYTLPRAWAARWPDSRLSVAEIDPAVTRIARRDFWVDTGGAIDPIHRDARAHLRGLPADARFDVVVGDAFHDISIPTHLATREFAREVRDRLEPGGLYLVNAIDRGRDPRFLLALVKTLQAVFPTVEVWVDREQLGGERATYLVVAGETPSPGPAVRSRDPIPRLWLRWPPERLAETVAAADVPVLSDDYAPVDRLMRAAARASP